MVLQFLPIKMMEPPEINSNNKNRVPFPKILTYLWLRMSETPFLKYPSLLIGSSCNSDPMKFLAALFTAGGRSES